MFLRLSGGVKAQQSAKAATMQLMKAEGDVTVSNAKGRALSIMEKMKLYNGYRTDTQEASYAWINLDDEKLTKMDAVSETEIRKNGKKLEILLKSGNLFFDVEEALTEEETLNIRTSTMTVGIRGTSGWAEVIDGMHSKIYILEGTVECTVSDPVSGEVRSATISSGETAEFVVYEEETNGKQCDIIVGSYKEEEIGGFILEELAEKPALCEKIQEASGLKVAEESKKAGERLAADEEKMGAVLASIQKEYAAQENHISEEPVWIGGGKLSEQSEDVSLSETEQAAADSASKSDKATTPKQDKTPVNSEIAQPVLQTQTGAGAVVPEQKKPAQTSSDNKGSSSGGSGGSGMGNVSGGSGWSPKHVENIDEFITKLEKWIEPGIYIVDKDTCPDGKVTIANGKHIVISTGVTLTLQGLDMEIEKGAGLQVTGGTLNIEKASARAADGGNLAVYGYCQVSSGALNVLGNLGVRNTDESGGGTFLVFNAQDAVSLQGSTITVTGKVTNDKGAVIFINKNGVLTVKNGLVNKGQLDVNGGEIIGNIHNEGPNDGDYPGVTVNEGGIISGNVFNEGVYPIIKLINGTIKKITNESCGTNGEDESYGRGIIRIQKKGTVIDAVDTRGGGNINIEKGAKIRNGLTSLQGPLTGFLGFLDVFLYENWEDTLPIKRWDVTSAGSTNKWHVNSNGDVAFYDSYSAAISEVNKELKPFLGNIVDDTSTGEYVVWDVPDPALITVQEIQKKLDENYNKKVVMKTSPNSQMTVTLRKGEYLNIQQGRALSLQGLDLVVEGSILSIHGTLEVKKPLASTNEGGNLTNYGGDIEVRGGGELIVDGDLENRRSSSSLGQLSAINYDYDIDTDESKITINRKVTNHEGGSITVGKGGQLEFQGDMDNNGNIFSSDGAKGGKITFGGNVWNGVGARIYASYGVLLEFKNTGNKLYNKGGLEIYKLDGEVVNQENEPYIELKNDGEIKKIINNSTKGRITIGNGTVTNGIVTNGGGTISIGEKANIGSGLTADSESPVAGMESLEVTFAGGSLRHGWVVRKNNEKWKMTFDTIYSPSDTIGIPCKSYQDAIEKLNADFEYSRESGNGSGGSGGDTPDGSAGSGVTCKYDIAKKILTFEGTGAISVYPWNAYRSEIQIVLIGDGITSIGDNAFSQCNNLRIVNLGSVTSIASNAFDSCNNLTTVTFGGTREAWNAMKVTLPNGITPSCIDD